MAKLQRPNTVNQAPQIEAELELETPGDPSAPQRAAPRVSGGADATLAMLAGLGLLSGGVALAVLPSLSWTANKIATRLDAVGLEAGVAIVGGLLLMGLGLIRRGQHSARAQMQDDTTLLFEQIAADLLDIRGALDATLARQDANEQRLSELKGELEQAKLALTSEIEAHAPRENSDALFQLASGLDKLGLRFEQRMRLHHTSLQESVDELAATVEHSRRALEEQMRTLGSVELGASTPLEVADAPQFRAAEIRAPDLEPREGSLGLLDQFEDVAPALPSEPPPAPVDEVESYAVASSFEATASQAHEQLDAAARAPRPSGTWDEELMVEAGPDEGTKAKLMQLESLLSDERLRSALDAMRRG
jgi:hypothetical protein